MKMYGKRNKIIPTGIGICAVLIFLGAAEAGAISVEEIIQKWEENQTHDTSRTEGRMEIRDRFGERVSTFISWSSGTQYTLAEFTSVTEAGQKILRTPQEVYIFYPDAAELIRLQGAALRDSLLGSDVSYEDLTGNRGLLDTYRVKLIGEEEYNGYPSYIVDLEAKVRDVAYPRQRLWIDTAQFVLRKAEQYALSGRLLKINETIETITVKGKTLPSRILIQDQLKRDSETEFIVEDIDVDVRLPAGIFSLENLSF